MCKCVLFFLLLVANCQASSWSPFGRISVNEKKILENQARSLENQARSLVNEERISANRKLTESSLILFTKGRKDVFENADDLRTLKKSVENKEAIFKIEKEKEKEYRQFDRKFYELKSEMDSSTDKDFKRLEKRIKKLEDKNFAAYLFGTLGFIVAIIGFFGDFSEGIISIFDFIERFRRYIRKI